MNDHILSISVSCRGNPECLFEGGDVFVDIGISNDQGNEVQIPLEYLRRAGPFVKLVDTRTKAETFLKGNLADPELRKHLTAIPPRGSVSIEWVLTAAELGSFGGSRVDLIAEFTIRSPVWLNGREVSFAGAGLRRMVSKDG